MKLISAIKYMEAAASQPIPALHDCDIESIAIDSREVRAGSVFFALSQPDYAKNGFNGDFEDATKYAAASFEKGAVAAVVRHDRYAEHHTELEAYADRLILVDDVIRALQNLAHGVYEKWGGKVIAVTGSAGKTTAKELTAHVLEHGGRKVLRNIKNYNNGLGHPLTVLNLANDDSYDVAVLEMGMSTPMHEIQRLCEITPPDISVVLNVLPVHVEHLGSIENVARAKAEIIEGMKPGGVAVLNADDVLAAEMRTLAPGRVITFGIEKSADVSAEDISETAFGESSFTLITPNGKAGVSFHLNGRHNILNALAAAAVGHEMGLAADEIAERLSSAVPPPQRGEILRFARGFTVINDSYNSNPAALLSMVRTLVSTGINAGRRIVVAGEMLELGTEQAELHRQAGKDIAALGVEKLIGVRGLASEMVSAARESGLDADFAEDSDAAADLLASIIADGDIVLVKGSRGVRTEKVVERLLKDFELEKE